MSTHANEDAETLFIYFQLSDYLQYYSYKDYCDIKLIFEDYDESSDDTVNIDLKALGISIIEHEQQNFTGYCKNLKKQFSKTTNSGLCSDNKCCSYINFLLNEELDKSVYTKKESSFGYFKKFMQNNDLIKSNPCVNQINHMNNELYKKMKSLYNLYDSYESYFFMNKYTCDTQTCEYLQVLVNDYNASIKEYKGKDDAHLLKKLTDVICLIKHDKRLSNCNCKKNVFQSFSSESNSLYNTTTCKTLDHDLLKFTDLIGNELSTGQESSTHVDSDSARATESGSHSISEENPDSEGDHGLEEGVSPSMDDSSESRTSRNITNTVLPLLAASSFTFLLYKVTPAGTLVNKFFGRNKNAYRNLDNIKKNALSNYKYETQERDPRIGTMNISYNTISNKIIFSIKNIISIIILTNNIQI